MGLKINLDNRTEFVPNLIATSKVQLDCQDPVASSDRMVSTYTQQSVVHAVKGTCERALTLSFEHHLNPVAYRSRF